MILITGLVCTINIFFVVDFLPTLHGLEYHIPLGLLLAAYVAFVAYLVGVAPRDRGGTVSLVGAHQPVLFAPADLDMQHRAWSPVPGPGPPQPVQFWSRPRPNRHMVTDPILLIIPTFLSSAASSHQTRICCHSVSGQVLARDAGQTSPQDLSAQRLFPPATPPVPGCWSRLDARGVG